MNTPISNTTAGAGQSSESIDERQITDAAERAAGAHAMMLEQMSRVIVGQRTVIDQLLLGLFCQGHCILEGVPGLAKTMMIGSLAKLLSLDFGRIQFTPDLMPSDITGTEILQEDRSTGARELRFVKGPIFANIILADEINRTPPKTQAALLQAMQESRVTVAGHDLELEPPFFVLGTQNPIESEGTYPLPEAQLDRFMFKVLVEYPDREEEIDIAMATTSRGAVDLEPVLTKQEILEIQSVVRRVIVSRSVASYAVRLVRSTRPLENSRDFIQHYLTWGAGPRACQALLLGAKARALLDGRPSASIEDIRSVAKPVLRHRIVTSFAAESEGVSADAIIDRLLQEIVEVE